MKHLKTIYFSNSWEHLLVSGAVILAVFLALLSIKRLLTARLYRKARQTPTYWDNILAETIASTNTLSLLVFSLLTGVYILDLPDEVNTVNAHLAAVVFLFQCGLWFSKAASSWLAYNASPELAQQGTNREVMNMHIIGFVTRVVIWSIALLLILDNLGINITALIASLGIGGVAVALAVQNILGDLFASLVDCHRQTLRSRGLYCHRRSERYREICRTENDKADEHIGRGTRYFQCRSAEKPDSQLQEDAGKTHGLYNRGHLRHVF